MYMCLRTSLEVKKKRKSWKTDRDMIVTQLCINLSSLLWLKGVDIDIKCVNMDKFVLLDLFLYTIYTHLYKLRL